MKKTLKWLSLLGSAAAATLQPSLASAAEVTTLYSIARNNDGSSPVGPLVEMDGLLYGVTSGGGNTNYGTIFSVDPNTGAESVEYSFSSDTDNVGVIQPLTRIGSALYGAANGGSGNMGIIFKFDPATRKAKLLYHFMGGKDDGDFLSTGLADYEGLLYGGSIGAGAYGNGVVFKIDPATGAETVVHSFNGAIDGTYPVGKFVFIDGLLYGANASGGPNGGGTLFRIDPATGAETVIYSFSNSIGSAPRSSPIDAGGKLYGTTTSGGSNTVGTVYKLNPATGEYTTIFNFTENNSPAGGLLDLGGSLYGTTGGGDFGAADCGSVYKIPPGTRAETVLYTFACNSDGASPDGGLINFSGSLYGVTRGTVDTEGTIFKIDPSSGAKTTLYRFTGPLAIQGNASLINVGGVLYGTSGSGRSNSIGAVFKVDPTTGAQTTLYNFNLNSGGENPEGSLADVRGVLYGTTMGGGVGGSAGTIFKIDPTTGVLTTLHSFQPEQSLDGGSPMAAMINLRGTLYGTTAFGGVDQGGTVFSINPVTGKEAVVYAFQAGSVGVDAARPEAPLIAFDGFLFGTTTGTVGAGPNCGSIFRLDPSTGTEHVIWYFRGGEDGAKPLGGLTNVAETFYGTTSAGGASGHGTVFKFDLKTQTNTTLYSFAGGNDGAQPEGTLTYDGGRLFGTTMAGGREGFGTIFAVDASTGKETVLYHFKGGADGGGPIAGLTRLGKDKYGITSSGGVANVGTVFKLIQ